MKAIHPDDADAMAQAWISSVSSGTPFRFEFRGLRASDQMYRWCVSSAVPLHDPDGRVVKWYGTVVDWHDWKEAQEALHGMQVELERAARVMTTGRLAASIAHEINQPLAATATNCETCLRWLAEETLKGTAYVLECAAPLLRLRTEALINFHLALSERAAFLKAELSSASSDELAYSKEAH
jgi:signal transduction histidine kinase